MPKMETVEAIRACGGEVSRVRNSIRNLARSEGEGGGREDGSETECGDDCKNSEGE